MRLPCPFCGERGNEEFAYLGDAGVAPPEGDDPGAWHDYVYLRDNPAGLHRELWYHSASCRQWLVVTRDVRTHAIAGVEPARDLAPARRKGAA